MHNSPEKNVTFYDTYGYQKGDVWVVPLRLWVSEQSDSIRRLAAKGARKVIRRRAGQERLSESQKRLFMSRVEGFIADSESREEVFFVFDNDPDEDAFQLLNAKGKAKTDRNGLLEGVLTLSAEKAKRLLDAQGSRQGWLSYRAVSGDHGGAGRVRLLSAAGVSVISDIDDTIKVTEINAGERAVLTNTFFRAFIAAPCMADMYRAFGPETAFHYVSGGPWQLYEPLTRFLFDGAVGFPPGSVHMKNVRTNPFESESYQDLWKLVVNGSQKTTFDQKVEQISAIITHFPQRRFILIGDSGEKDPEVFTAVKTRFADQIQELRIRDIVNDADNNPGRLAGMTVIAPDPDPDPNLGAVCRG